MKLINELRGVSTKNRDILNILFGYLPKTTLVTESDRWQGGFGLANRTLLIQTSSRVSFSSTQLNSAFVEITKRPETQSSHNMAKSFTGLEKWIVQEGKLLVEYVAKPKKKEGKTNQSET